MTNVKALAWLIPALIAAAASDYVPSLLGPGAAIAFVFFIGFFYSATPRRITARGAAITAASFGLISFFIAGRINDSFSPFMAERAVAVFVAPFAEEILKAGGIYVLALKRRAVLRPWRTAAICGFLAGLVFGVAEGILQPSVYRPVTALTHALGTMLFALGVRLMIVGKGRRDGVLAGLCISAAILEHMAWNAFAPLLLP
jgi:RsiW-degrading membrane proteinase PrsW (M82 family)